MNGFSILAPIKNSISLIVPGLCKLGIELYCPVENLNGVIIFALIKKSKSLIVPGKCKFGIELYSPVKKWN